MRRITAILFAALLVIWISGCSPQPEITGEGGPSTDYAGLVANLREAGLTVEETSQIDQPFFSVQGYVIQVDGQDVQVFQFEDAEDAAADASEVSRDGGTIGTSAITWAGEPHFFRSGRVIVLYVGSDSQVLDALEKELGQPFAGG